LFASLGRRGLAEVFTAAVQALAPLWVSDRHVGMAVRYGNAMYATLDPNAWGYTHGVQDAVPVYTQATQDHYRAAAIPFGMAAGLPLVRQARSGEVVHVVGVDGEAAFTSEPLRVEQVSPDSRRFWLTAPLDDVTSPYFGGLVLAVSDCAVVGQYVTSERTGRGLMARCVSFLPRSASAAEPVRIVASVSHHVHPVVWPQTVLTDFFSNDVATVRTYSEVGRSAAQAAVLVELARVGRVEVAAAVVARWEEPQWATTRLQDGDVARLVTMTGGRLTPVQQLEYVFAFLGIVAVYEGYDALLPLLGQFGWFEAPPESGGLSNRTSVVSPVSAGRMTPTGKRG